MAAEPDYPPPSVNDVDAIHNIDTARMALRWALERVHALEQTRQALEKRSAEAEGALRRTQDELAASGRALALRSGDQDQRNEYYRKLEEFLALKLDGKLDAAELARRELEAARLKELCDARSAQGEKELVLRRAELTREIEAARAEAERFVRERLTASEQATAAKSRSLEQEHLARLGAVRERELVVRHEEKALAERQARFEEYYATQRAELHAQLKHFRDEIDAQVRFRAELAERMLEQRHESLEGGWRRERELLARELELWKAKALEASPKVLELERALALAEESARQARSASDLKTMIFEEQRRSFEALKDELVKLAK